MLYDILPERDSYRDSISNMPLPLLSLDKQLQMKKILRTTTDKKEVQRMKNINTIVGYLGGSCKGKWDEQREWENAPPSSAEIKMKIKSYVNGLFDFVDKDRDSRQFDEVERSLKNFLFALGRLFLAYFVALRHERSEREISRWEKEGYRREEKPQRKYIETFFGRVCFWRTYVRWPGSDGLHPLDLALGLTADGFSFWVMELSARLSTLLSYDQVTGILLYFLSWSPSKTTVEKAVLGFGRYTEEWFESAPAPEGDGEILVTQFDSKATPTATEEELEKRRGKRKKNQQPLSPRHRGRAKRKRQSPKKRRKKGDKSKNGKAATLVVMYTLKKARDKEGNPVLLGPINKKVYASYAPKRHAFAIARREADKRGFTKKSRKKVQIVTDGDEDLARLVKEFFPGATHTLDIIHALEYVWEAGRFLFEEGSDELTAWVKKQERLLYMGKAADVYLNLNDTRWEVAPKDLKRLDAIRNYIHNRLDMMAYNELRKEDLEVASGAVEGAVKHVIAKRFDYGGMRWIRERAEALLQLRCIEINGDWPAFVEFVRLRSSKASEAESRAKRLLTTKSRPLPTFGVAC